MTIGKVSSYALICIGTLLAGFSGLLGCFAMIDAEETNPGARLIITLVGVMLGCILVFAGRAGARRGS